MKPFPKENLKMSAKVTFFAFFKTRSTRNPIYNCLTYDLQLSLKPHLELNVCKLVCSLRTTHLSRTQLLLILTSCLNIISLDFARLANDFKPCNCIFIKRNSKKGLLKRFHKEVHVLAKLYPSLLKESWCLLKRAIFC